jgi:hypothetical protein
MKLSDIVNQLEIWGDWNKNYNNWVPKFITEARTKTNYQDWDKKTFQEFFEQARDQSVSSLQQGYFSNAEKQSLKQNWNTLAPLFKSIAESQNSMKLDTYQAIDRAISKYTSQHRRASINRLIASLQPKLLCTIVNESKLNRLIQELNNKIENCSIKKTNNWFENSHAVLNFFANELNQPAEEIMTLPWQVYLSLTSKKPNSSTPNLMDDEDTIQEKPDPMEKVLNQILYGPPGTGKTFHTINKALEIVDPLFLANNPTRQKIAERFRSLLYDEKTNPNGQIVFTTFHQSLAYEDFIEGIKPTMNDINEEQDSNTEEQTPGLDYIIKDGIFKVIVDLANKRTKSSVEFDSLWNNYISEIRNHTGEKTFTSVSSELKLDSIEPNGNSINVRFKKSWNPNEPEGTRAFIVSKNMIERLFDARVDGSESNKQGRVDVKKHVGGGRATFIYAVYKDFYQYAESKGAYTQDDNLNYVIIIDEINRGNVSAIFGELITLLEDDKRLGKDNELTVTLPYSKDKFGVPSNLYIIGTMNTADRSVEALDTALRRRFSFEEMLPQPELLSPSAMFSRLMWKYKELDWEDSPYLEKETALKELFGIPDGPEWEGRIDTWNKQMKDQDESVLTHLDELNAVARLNLQALLETINSRIEVLVDRDHTIGHAYFMDVDSMDSLKHAFKNKIIPLLQEYFYGDYRKMEMVIGQYFFDQEKKKAKANLFAVTKDPYDVETGVYQLKNIDSVDFNIKDALDVLLKKKKLEDVLQIAQKEA